VWLALLLALAIAALFDVFGQRTSTTTSAAPGRATLAVDTPSRLRGGLFFQTRFTVLAKSAIAHPRLVLSKSWFEGMTLNTTEPSAESEGTRQGAVTFTFPALAPGDTLTFYTEWQVNPTTVGNRTRDVELDDGSAPITRVRRGLTVFP
jgi:hypothetical protein